MNVQILGKKRGLTATMVILVSAALVALAPGRAQGKGEEMVGKPARQFSEGSVNKGFVTLASCKGKIVLLDFWATWCGPCVKEMPNIKKLNDRFKGKDFVLIGVSLDSDRQALNGFIRKNNVDWPIVFDGRGWKNRIAALYGVSSIPFTVLIDRAGIVRHVGLRGNDLERTISRMLAP